MRRRLRHAFPAFLACVDNLNFSNWTIAGLFGIPCYQVTLFRAKRRKEVIELEPELEAEKAKSPLVCVYPVVEKEENAA